MSTINGGSGNDTQTGGSGDDLGYGGAGSDTFYGGEGNDGAYGGTGNDRLEGGNGNDALTGEKGNDSVYGGSGQDTVIGGQGHDTLYGGNDNDMIVGDGQWLMISQYASGSSGTPTNLTITNSADGPIDLYWIDGNGAQIYYATIQSGQTLVQPGLTSHNWVLKDPDGYFLEPITGASNQSVTYGPDLVDTIYGGSGDDDIRAQYGNDIVYGDDGNDTVRGGYGDDSVYGGTGNDTLFGEAGNDTVHGDAGNDTAYGGTGNDVIGGWGAEGGGDDTLYGGDGADTVIGGTGNDVVHGDAGNDILSGGAGADTVYGGADSDLLIVTEDHETDTFYGGETGTDYDIISFGNYLTAQGVNVNFTGAESGSYNYSGGAASGSFSQVEGISGTGNADTINASNSTANQTLWGQGGDDTLSGGSGHNSIYGGTGQDSIFGGSGNDYVQGDDGNDTVYAGSGNDTVYAGNDNDYVDGSTGDDAIAGETGNDTVYGGDGNDAVYGGAGADTLFGDAGNDQIYYGDGSNAVYGGGGDDFIDDVGGGNVSGGWTNTVFGGAGNDSVWGSGDSDIVYGEDGNDRINADNGNDTVYGGVGDDSLEGSGGNDSLSGDDGHDSVFGGSGQDNLTGGSGNDVLGGGGGTDTLSGGAGNDHFQFENGSGTDVITDFSVTDSDADGHYDDQLDVSDLTNSSGGPVTAWDVVVTDDGFGNAKLTFPQGETIILQGVSPAQMATAQQRHAAGIPCFTSGTLILTPRGQIPVQDLRPGDLVITMDNGIQPVVWAAQRLIGQLELMAQPRLLPVRLTRAFTGSDRQLLVSPQHGVLVRRHGAEVLARAAHLAKLGSGQARVAKGVTAVTYVHLMFAHHQIIWSNGVPSESFYPGGWGLAMLDQATLLSFIRTFPSLARLGSAEGYGPTARPVLRMTDLRDDVQGFPRVAARPAPAAVQMRERSIVSE